ncbi:YgfZ/GcvT domain-containing protein [Pyruvatibacter mobilis]|uniref:CAF17-like 4Fe-4S cluster assembly/insertion protein YgfZ n=1 Tax=Pyruvatibacter mobilis TaxID=1712261 RepID=UPI003BA89416
MSNTRTALLDDRRVLRAHGADVHDLLQRLVTGNLETVDRGTPVYSLLLTPQGKFLFDFFIAAEPGREASYLIDCAASRAAELQKRLTMYKLRADAAFDDASADYCVAARFGDGAEAFDGSVSYEDPRAGFLGTRAFVPTGAEIADADASAEDYRSFCVSRGVPDGAQDIGADKDFPIECNLDLLNGIDFKKGCFVGQEVASRMHRKGKARKRLVVAAMEGDAPDQGTDITMGDAKVGSICGHAGNDALALVFLDRVARAGDADAQAGDTRLTLRVPPYAAFTLDGTLEEDAQ